jgi:predicted RNA-binding Zn ribbon-like protein
MASASSSPHDLDLVIDFVNTFDPDTDADELESVEGLRRWFVEHELLEARDGGPFTEGDRQEAISLREALRTMMLANNGERRDDAAAAALESAGRRGRLELQFTGEGAVTLRPAAEGFRGSLARLLIPVAEAAQDGTWPRVKACRADDCQWAFYDRSRNRSGVWCDMSVCGNRTKVRAYRARHPGAGRGA